MDISVTLTDFFGVMALVNKGSYMQKPQLDVLLFFFCLFFKLHDNNEMRSAKIHNQSQVTLKRRFATMILHQKHTPDIFLSTV